MDVFCQASHGCSALGSQLSKIVDIFSLLAAHLLLSGDKKAGNQARTRIQHQLDFSKFCDQCVQCLLMDEPDPLSTVLMPFSVQDLILVSLSSLCQPAADTPHTVNPQQAISYVCADQHLGASWMQ